jgi:hypothetical protein
MRVLRGSAGFLANALTAVIGVSILTDVSWRIVKLFTQSMTVAYVLTESIGGIVFAALLGVSVQRRWRTRTARWVWMPALLWFLFGLFGMMGRVGNPWLSFSGIACVREHGNLCIEFTIFTVPLVRASTYSLASLLSSRSRSQDAAELHPVLSHLLSGLFLVRLPQVGDERSKEQAVTNHDETESKQR